MDSKPTAETIEICHKCKRFTYLPLDKSIDYYCSYTGGQGALFSRRARENYYQWMCSANNDDGSIYTWNKFVLPSDCPFELEHVIKD